MGLYSIAYRLQSPSANPHDLMMFAPLLEQRLNDL
jgi:hypothetical protein